MSRPSPGGVTASSAVNCNQPKLLAAIRASFLGHPGRDLEDLRYRCHETREDGHGRIDERSYDLTTTPRDFAPREDWPWVKVIGYRVRITQRADGTETDEVRYYLSTRYLSGQRPSVRRGGPRPLVDRGNTLGARRELPWGTP